MTVHLSLSILPPTLAICKLSPETRVPEWAQRGAFSAITRTPEELSVVCPAENVPPGIRCERGWRCLKVGGPLDFSLTGVLASLALPLANAGISIFAISTFDTDYILVPDHDLERAVRALTQAGHHVQADK